MIYPGSGHSAPNIPYSSPLMKWNTAVLRAYAFFELIANWLQALVVGHARQPCVAAAAVVLKFVQIAVVDVGIHQEASLIPPKVPESIDFALEVRIDGQNCIL